MNIKDYIIDQLLRSMEKTNKEIHWMDKILEKSSMTSKDADVISHKLKSEMRKRFL